MFRPKGSFRYAGKGPIVPVFVDIDECNVGVVGATLPVGISNCGFSIPVIDVIEVRELFRNFSTPTLG